jgi:hypothetical protein
LRQTHDFLSIVVRSVSVICVAVGKNGVDPCFPEPSAW